MGTLSLYARMAELVDAADLKSVAQLGVRVRIPLRVQVKAKTQSERLQPWVQVTLCFNYASVVELVDTAVSKAADYSHASSSLA